VQRPVTCPDILNVNLSDLDEWIQYDSQNPINDCIHTVSHREVWQGNVIYLTQGQTAALISPFPISVFWGRAVRKDAGGRGIGREDYVRRSDIGDQS